MKWKIEKVKKEDCRFIVGFISQAWNDVYKDIINSEFLINLKSSEEERYIKAINNFKKFSSMSYIIKDNSKIIAYLKLHKEVKNIELQALYVSKEYQKQGIGKALIQKAFNEARKLGYDKIIIGCLEENKSNEFYKKMGCNIIDKREFKLPNQILYENVYEYYL